MGARSAVILEERAQATVELAVVAPVLLVLILISYNLMVFVSAAARFDRVAPDIVLGHGSSYVGAVADSSAEVWGAADAVRRELDNAMEGYEVEIEVESIEGAGGEKSSIGGALGQREGQSGSPSLGLMGSLRTFRCVMRYRPWPQGWSIAGVELGAPFFIEHERCVTIDPWRSGVIA